MKINTEEKNKSKSALKVKIRLKAQSLVLHLEICRLTTRHEKKLCLQINEAELMQTTGNIAYFNSPFFFVHSCWHLILLQKSETKEK
jgi:urease accessory protein UreE